MTEDEQRNKALEDAVRMLSEYFDSVQVLATHVSNDGWTKGYAKGRGDWYSRKGMAIEFIDRDTARVQYSEVEDIKGGQ